MISVWVLVEIFHRPFFSLHSFSQWIKKFQTHSVWHCLIDALAPFRPISRCIRRQTNFILNVVVSVAFEDSNVRYIVKLRVITSFPLNTPTLPWRLASSAKALPQVRHQRFRSQGRPSRISFPLQLLKSFNLLSVLGSLLWGKPEQNISSIIQLHFCLLPSFTRSPVTLTTENVRIKIASKLLQLGLVHRSFDLILWYN